MSYRSFVFKNVTGKNDSVEADVHISANVINIGDVKGSGIMGLAIVQSLDGVKRTTTFLVNAGKGEQQNITFACGNYYHENGGEFFDVEAIVEANKGFLQPKDA